MVRKEKILPLLFLLLSSYVGINVEGSIILPSVCYAPPDYNKIDNTLKTLGLKRNLDSILFFRESDFFFNHTSTGVRIYKINDTLVVYLQMWKVGSVFINCNLAAKGPFKKCEDENGDHDIEAKQGAKTASTFASKLKEKDFKVSSSYSPEKLPKIFTFVRDPIDILLVGSMKCIFGNSDIYFSRTPRILIIRS